MKFDSMKKVVAALGIVVIIFGSFWFYLDQNYELPIFMYHSLDKTGAEKSIVVSPERFYQQMKFIKQNKYKVISLDEYCKWIRDDKLVPKKSVVITFDDGYKDNLTAIKTLEQFGYPATIFLIVNEIGKGDYLSQADIRSFLANTNVKIGSHTSNHIYLPDVEEDTIKEEVIESKIYLGRQFSYNIETISYPVGGFNEQVLEEVEEGGYLCGCTTNRGFSRKLNRFALRRIKITNRDSSFKLWAKLSGFYNVFKKPKKPY